MKTMTPTRNVRSGARLLIAALTLLMIAAVTIDAREARAGAAAPVAAPHATPAAVLPVSTCTLAGSTRTCELWAKTGSITLPGPLNVPVWGYSDTAGGAATLPGPTLIVNQGETVEVVLHNGLPEATALAVPGQGLEPDPVGVSTGGTKTYTFAAAQPGTYLYEAGLTANGPVQVAMGLFGALIVRPAACVACAYSVASTFDDEALLVLSEIDPAFNNAPATFDMSEYAPKYWLINGKAYPDTATIDTAAGNRVLLRYLNAGLEHHSMALLGLHQTVLATDGKPLPFSYDVVAETVPAGASLDTIATVPPAAALGTMYALYNAGSHLDNAGALTLTGQIDFGGMLTFLSVQSASAGDNAGPATTNVQAAPNPTDGSGNVTLTATGDDTFTGNSAIAAAEWFEGTDPGQGSGTPMAATNAPFDSPTEALTATFTVGTWSVGDHTLSVRARDAAGNWGPVATTVLKIDDAGPATTAISLTPNPTNNSVGVTLQATGDDTSTGNSNVVAGELFIDDATCANGTGTPLALNAAPAPTAGLSGTLPGPALAAGSHTVYVHSQDAANNWGACAPAVLIVDTTGPATSGVAAAPNPTNGSPNVTLSATGNDAATGNSNIAAGEWFVGTDPGPGAGTAMAATDGTFNSPAEGLTATINVAAWPAGSYTLAVRAKDAAGNWGAIATTSLTVADTLFADGFESGNLTAWSASSGGPSRISVTPSGAMAGSYGMQTVISGNTPSYVQDDTPATEASYHARFYFNPNGTSTGGGRHSIFVGRNSGGTIIFRIEYRRTGNGPYTYQVRSTVRRSNGSEAATSWYTISNAAHAIEIAWQSSLSAPFSLYVDGVLKQTLTNLNTNVHKLESVRLGPSVGLSGAMAGTEYYDAFVSTRTAYVGP